MNKRLTFHAIMFLLFVFWGIRYLWINDSNIGAYTVSNIEDYKMGSIVEFGDNKSYYLYTQDGYTISVQSAKKYSKQDFCDYYKIATDDLPYVSDSYIEISTIIENKGETESNLQLLGLALRGADWCAFYDAYATTYANEVNNAQGTVSSIQLPKDTPVNIRMIYGIQRGNFPLSRWNNIENEDIWLIVTIMPIEKRIRIKL